MGQNEQFKMNKDKVPEERDGDDMQPGVSEKGWNITQQNKMQPMALSQQNQQEPNSNPQKLNFTSQASSDLFWRHLHPYHGERFFS